LVKWTKEYDGGKIFVEARETRDRKLELHVIAQSKEDLIIHWGSTTVKDGTWKSPPDGFVTKPARSWASSGKSWETEFERVSRDVHAVTLEAPVNGGRAGRNHFRLENGFQQLDQKWFARFLCLSRCVELGSPKAQGRTQEGKTRTTRKRQASPV
jgi:alpha-glucan,water dikinase